MKLTRSHLVDRRFQVFHPCEWRGRCCIAGLIWAAGGSILRWAMSVQCNSNGLGLLPETGRLHNGLSYKFRNSRARSVGSVGSADELWDYVLDTRHRLVDFFDAVHASGHLVLRGVATLVRYLCLAFRPRVHQ
ncbi:conserved hypothetical protein [Thiomonas arsenitoxydans]|uniref:Uncharacterized protein n=1 Tax=Thiomonas arsenitoxydans (strain DSM 22701 / CIP 110005 / 3As) TaxID=426114 RepID=D6CQ55_THIA3|nr:hypothetical protein THI_1451 [Thiomonas arsenitoxydans]CQR32454.1 conserved hypothetical protein [Thiomonas arsenitoxydans]CQR32795.1 conserved hypothetical protein [Thiomonas arsenitoxydans]CQR34201.1 conserved hypothetical protein [Thiomonas arsenitoxydans]CQR40488.1 conserved hypothetical protein [Thiomonas arsenitoxydans]